MKTNEKKSSLFLSTLIAQLRLRRRRRQSQPAPFRPSFSSVIEKEMTSQGQQSLVSGEAIGGLCPCPLQVRSELVGLLRSCSLLPLEARPEYRFRCLRHPLRDQVWPKEKGPPQKRRPWDPDPPGDPDPGRVNPIRRTSTTILTPRMISEFLSPDPEFIVQSQKPRSGADNVRSEEAAEIRAGIRLLGFNGKRGMLAPTLLGKMTSEPRGYLAPVVWTCGNLDPAFPVLSPFAPRCCRVPCFWEPLLVGPGFCRTSVAVQTVEWLWYRDGFDIIHEDKGMERGKRRRGAGKTKTAEDTVNGVLSRA